MFSDVFGKAASAITARILENPTEKITDVSGFRTKGMKATNEQVLAAVDGVMCEEQAEKFRINCSHMDSLELCKLNLESLILSVAEKYLPQLGLVMTAPGIQSFAAIGIISEIGVDMSVFPTSKHLCSWAGITLQNNESAGKKKNQPSRCLHQTVVVQCALCAICVKQFPEVRNHYLALKKCRGHKKAIIAIARMLLTAIYNMLKKNEPYTARANSHPHIEKFPWKKPSSFYNGKVI